MSQQVIHAGSDTGEHEALDRIQTISHLLDDAIPIPGTDIRVGLDPILGIIPGAGDTVASAVSLYIIVEGYRADAPPELLIKMLSLVAIDTLVGSVPILGTLFDAFWKANRWNTNMLASHLEDQSA